MLGPVVYLTDYWQPRTRVDWLSVLFGGGLIIAAYNAFIFIGEQTVSGSVAGIRIALNPILATVFSRVLLSSERLDATRLTGLFIGFLGVVIIVRPNPGNLLAGNVVGQLLVLAAAASLALGSVITRRLDADQPVETMETWSMLLGAVVLHIVSGFRPTETFAAIEWTPDAILWLGYLAVLSSAVAYFIFFDLLERLGPIEINLVAYAAAAFGVLFGWLVLAEQMDAYTYVGFGVIFAGFALLKHRELHKEYTRVVKRYHRT